MKRQLGDQIEVLKILNGYATSDTRNLFSLMEDITKGHLAMLVKKQWRLGITKVFVFKQRNI